MDIGLPYFNTWGIGQKMETRLLKIFWSRHQVWASNFLAYRQEAQKVIVLEYETNTRGAGHLTRGA